MTVLGYVVMANHRSWLASHTRRIQVYASDSAKPQIFATFKAARTICDGYNDAVVGRSFWLTRQAELSWPDLQ